MSGHLYMPLWTDAYLGDTRHLTTLQHGIYLLLLMSMWRNGGTLPNDEKLLSRYAGLSLDKWRKNAPTIMGLFEVEDNNLTQKRLRLELEKALGLTQKRAQAGSAGGRAKSLKSKGLGQANATDLPDPSPEQNRSLQNQIQNQNQRKKETGTGRGTDPEPDDPMPWEVGGTATTPSPIGPELDRRGQPYGFSDGAIKLNQRDFDAFVRAFPHIDVEAELIGLSGWATRLKGEGKDWFDAIKASLSKKNREAGDKRLRIKAEAEAAAKRASAGPRPGQAAI
ncbi:DUF1376 domain-containing protein [uncultured Methylobacterium sp.]|jgi:uncharacterized protein YdaU (DUF1376 family)|uniref:YdaU family protein n=1 Tax=uncultured Methylobacterium sp. TaxID=157278 RepID=UPI0026173100|nr:DUF1376 domain-containing protein [uncultured Methylobacterium sp.]